MFTVRTLDRGQEIGVISRKENGRVEGWQERDKLSFPGLGMAAVSR